MRFADGALNLEGLGISVAQEGILPIGILAHSHITKNLKPPLHHLKE